MLKLKRHGMRKSKTKTGQGNLTQKSDRSMFSDTFAALYISDIMAASLFSENAMLGLLGSISPPLEPVSFTQDEAGFWEPVWNDKYSEPETQTITMNWVEDRINAFAFKRSKSPTNGNSNATSSGA